MIMYEAWWMRYFRSERKLSDFYSGFLGIPLAGATLPVIAFFMLGMYDGSQSRVIVTGQNDIIHTADRKVFRKMVALVLQIAHNADGKNIAGTVDSGRELFAAKDGFDAFLGGVLVVGLCFGANPLQWNLNTGFR